jgi:putative hydrolase of the HAD superfamily
LQAFNWEAVEMVVFDMDGTLYDQKKLRVLMARDLLFHSLKTMSFGVVGVLKAYREIRERLGNEEVFDFEPKLVEEVAVACRTSPDIVSEIVSEWINNRPVPYVKSCRFKGVQALFENLQRHGKLVGILSDYPALSKAEALGIRADFIVCANDHPVKVLKPNTRGLSHIMSVAGVTADTTVMIGDRIERDGYAARRLGVRALIKSSKEIPDWKTFVAYDDAIFEGILAT